VTTEPGSGQQEIQGLAWRKPPRLHRLHRRRAGRFAGVSGHFGCPRTNFYPCRSPRPAWTGHPMLYAPAGAWGNVGEAPRLTPSVRRRGPAYEPVNGTDGDATLRPAETIDGPASPSCPGWDLRRAQMTSMSRLANEQTQPLPDAPRSTYAQYRNLRCQPHAQPASLWHSPQGYARIRGYARDRQRCGFLLVWKQEITSMLPSGWMM
jgi:hypothetical protein